jgi:beta-N-acetylhexosaminidase
MALGAANDPALTQQIAQALAAEIAACGVNLNLAPVLDVNRQPRNPIINVRSFGSDPRRVAQQGSATIKGLQERGVIATGKHFPGHGRTTTDSHYTLPIVEGDSAQILGDLAPFEAALAAEIGAIMSAHVVYPTLDAANPATLSAPILTDLLRNQLGYQGVIISDALTMGAISAARSTITAALRDALLAGVDVLAYGAYPNGRPPTLAEQIAGVEAVIGLVETGALAETVITQAARRVLTLKARFNLLSWQPLDPLRVLERMDLQDHNDLLAQAAERSITLYKDLPLQIPLDPRQPLVLLYPETLPQAGAIFNRDLPDALSLAYPLSPQVGQVEGLISQIGERRVICLTLDAHRHAGQVNLISALPLDRSVILAAQSPYDLLYFPPLPTYLLCYGTSRHALEAARNVIFGQKLAWGQLPVSLEGV